MKAYWNILLLLIPVSLFSQDTLRTSEVPDLVVNNFERRNRGADNMVWFKEDDHFLVSYTTPRGDKETKYYDKDGRLQRTVQKLPVEDIRRNMTDYIRSEYRNYRVQRAYFIEEGRRDRYFSIIMHHRHAQDPPETEIQFDQSGRFLTIINLYIPEEDDKEEEEFDAAFARQLEQDDLRFSEDLVGQEVRRRELPSQTLQYMDNHYPRPPYRMESAVIDRSPRGPIYNVIIKIQGEDHHYRLKFLFDGELVSDEKEYE